MYFESDENDKQPKIDQYNFQRTLKSYHHKIVGVGWQNDLELFILG